MNRLATLDENLVNEVRQRSLAELARICGEAAALSLTNSEIHDEFLDACLSRILAGESLSVPELSSMARIVEALDDEQWALHENADSEAESTRALIAVRRARAANALLLASAVENRDIACEVLYESYASGVDLESLRCLVRDEF